MRLDFELGGDEEYDPGGGPKYDSAFYANRLLWAAASVLVPLGWDGTQIRRYLHDVEEVPLPAFEHLG